MTKGPPVQVQKVLQKLRNKKMTRLELGTANTKYKQTIKEFYKSKPTSMMQKLDKEIKDLEQAVNNAPEPLTNEDTPED